MSSATLVERTNGPARSRSLWLDRARRTKEQHNKMVLLAVDVPPRPMTSAAAIQRIQRRNANGKADPALLPQHRSALRSGASPEMQTQLKALRIISNAMRKWAKRRTEKGEWRLMRSTHHVNVSINLAKLNRRASAMALTDFSAHTTMMGNAESEIPIWMQGSASLHTEEAWKRRLKLRKHPLVAKELRSWCTVFDMPVSFGDYADLMMNMYKVLIDPYEEVEARMSAEDDWRSDLARQSEDSADDNLEKQTLLGSAAFMDSLFELADHVRRAALRTPKAQAQMMQFCMPNVPASHLVNHTHPTIDSMAYGTVDAGHQRGGVRAVSPRAASRSLLATSGCGACCSTTVRWRSWRWGWRRWRRWRRWQQPRRRRW